MLSIIICTYNRDYILDKCLNSFTSIEPPEIYYELIIVDNNSDDSTKDITLKYQERLPIKYHFESTQGHSHTRNIGVKIAKYDWILFLDDDVRLFPNTLIEVENTIKSKRYDMVGGIFKGWFIDKRPKWFPESEASYVMIGENKFRDIGDDYVIGCVMILNKSSLKKVGGFDTSFGMKGLITGYGDESDIQYKFQKHGFKVGINPNIKVEHLVHKYKQSVLWQLKSRYKKGIYNVLYKQSLYERIELISKYFLKSFIYIPISIYKYLTKTGYYHQNLIIDMFNNPLYFLGSLKGITKSILR